MEPFEKFKRKAVIVVPTHDNLRRRTSDAKRKTDTVIDIPFADLCDMKCTLFLYFKLLMDQNVYYWLVCPTQDFVFQLSFFFTRQHNVISVCLTSYHTAKNDSWLVFLFRQQIFALNFLSQFLVRVVLSLPMWRRILCKAELNKTR